MGYQSRLSKGCEECRARKVKCDQKRPSCGNCTARKKSCPGYRDLTNLVFREQNETKKSSPRRDKVRRAPRRTPSSTSGEFSEHIDNSSRNATNTTVQVTHMITYTPAADPEQLSIGFYMTSYDLSGYPGAYLVYVPKMYECGPKTSPIAHMVETLGMAHLGQVHGSQKLLVGARLKYDQAVKRLNTALSDAVEAASDETLASILLFCFFETICATGAQEEANLKAHAAGLQALLRVRGMSQFKTPLGRQMYMEVLTILVHKCITFSHPFPEELMPWHQACNGAISPLEVPVFAIFSLLIRIANLRGGISNGTVTNAFDALQTATGIIEEMDQWTQMINPFVAPEAIACLGDPSPPFLDYYYQWQHPAAFGNWNYLRFARLLVTDVAMDCLHDITQQPSFSSNALDQAMQEDMRQSLLDIMQDICASVPYLFGSKAESWKSGSPWAPMLAMTVASPLIAIHKSAFAPPEMKSWVLLQLSKIGSVLGIGYARMVSEAASLEKQKQVEGLNV